MSEGEIDPLSSRCTQNEGHALDSFSELGIQRRTTASSSETTPKQPHSIQTNPPLGSLHVDASVASISDSPDEIPAAEVQNVRPSDNVRSKSDPGDQSAQNLVSFHEDDDEDEQKDESNKNKNQPSNIHFNVGGNTINGSRSNVPVVHTEFRDKDGAHYKTTVYQGGSGMPTTVMQVGNGNNITVYQNGMGRSFSSHSGRSNTGASSGASNNPRTKTTPAAPRQIVVPNRVVEPADLDRVSKLIPKQWKSVGRQLKVSDSTMETLEVDHGREGVNEVAYQMLRHWAQSNGEAATMQVLAKALVDAKCVEVVEKVLSTKNKN